MGQDSPSMPQPTKEEAQHGAGASSASPRVESGNSQVAPQQTSTSGASTAKVPQHSSKPEEAAGKPASEEEPEIAEGDKKLAAKSSGEDLNVEVSGESKMSEEEGGAKASTDQPGTITGVDQQRLEFNRKRNSVYSRRKYIRRKIEFEVLQEQSYTLKSQHHDLKKENQRLEAMYATAQQKMAIHELQLAQLAAPSLQLRHPSFGLASMVSPFGLAGSTGMQPAMTNLQSLNDPRFSQYSAPGPAGMAPSPGIDPRLIEHYRNEILRRQAPGLMAPPAPGLPQPQLQGLPGLQSHAGLTMPMTGGLLGGGSVAGLPTPYYPPQQPGMPSLAGLAQNQMRPSMAGFQPSSMLAGGSAQKYPLLEGPLPGTTGAGFPTLRLGLSRYPPPAGGPSGHSFSDGDARLPTEQHASLGGGLARLNSAAGPRQPPPASLAAQSAMLRFLQASVGPSPNEPPLLNRDSLNQNQPE